MNEQDLKYGDRVSNKVLGLEGIFIAYTGVVWGHFAAGEQREMSVLFVGEDPWGISKWQPGDIRSVWNWERLDD